MIPWHLKRRSMFSLQNPAPWGQDVTSALLTHALPSIFFFSCWILEAGLQMNSNMQLPCLTGHSRRTSRRLNVEREERKWCLQGGGNKNTSQKKLSFSSSGNMLHQAAFSSKHLFLFPLFSQSILKHSSNTPFQQESCVLVWLFLQWNTWRLLWGC